jgi:hypothetical protein
MQGLNQVLAPNKNYIYTLRVIRGVLYLECPQLTDSTLYTMHKKLLENFVPRKKLHRVSWPHHYNAAADETLSQDTY